MSELLSTDEINCLRELIKDRTGILISEKKNFELITKLSPELENIAIDERKQFITKAIASKEHLQTIVNRVTIGESYFFRNHPHFEALRHKIIPALIKKNATTRKLSIWSAGCSTGEEPYSISILIHKHFPELQDWEIKIHATDINTSFLDRAKEGKYTSWSFRGVDPVIIKNYFNQTSPNNYLLFDHIKEKVTFDKFNLSNMPYKESMVDLPFDLVICRNVLIYFSNELSNQIIRSFAEVIDRGGYLILGHSESFPSLHDLETVYSHATYYYHRPVSLTPKKSEDTYDHSVSLIPGIAGYEADPRPVQTKYTTPASSFSTGASSSVSLSRTTRESSTAKVEPNTEEMLNKVRESSLSGDIKNAQDVLSKLLTGNSKLDYRVHFLNAIIQDQDNNPDGALLSLRQSIFLNKNFIIAHYYQGVISEREGDRQTAKRSFRNVCDLLKKVSNTTTLEEGGGITSDRLMEIATERLKELEF